MGNYYGLAFPLVFSNGVYVEPTLEQSIESSVKNILAYERITRPFLPDFFGSLYYELSKPNDSISEATIRERIINAINKYEPRITIQDIKIDRSTDEVKVEIFSLIKDNRKDLIITING